MTFSHILFPVDFSERCVAARPMVEAWARQFQAKVTLMHTIQIAVSAYAGVDGNTMVVDYAALESIAKERLDRFEFADAERVITLGDPAYEIEQLAEKQSVDLIMMATHGYGKFRSFLMGSVASKVLHDAHCPVWTSAHPEDAGVRTGVKNILCVIEDTNDATQVLQRAEGLSEKFGATLHQFHAHGGPVSQVVRDAALQHDADLVVIDSMQVHKRFGTVRGHTFAILHDSPCAVLSL